MNVWVVVTNEMLTGVIPSQVLAPARAHVAAFPNLKLRIIFLEPARVALSNRARRRLEELRQMWPAGEMAVCPYVGRLGSFAPALSIRLAIEVGGRASTPAVFHCRGPEATIQAAH